VSPGKKQLPPPGGADPLREALTQRLADRPAEPAASPPPAPSNGTVPAPERAPEAPVASPPPPEMDEARQARWRHDLNAYALKVVAARTRAEGAVREWETLLADARAAGVPGHLIVAAAAAANLETPGLGDIPA